MSLPLHLPPGRGYVHEFANASAAVWQIWNKPPGVTMLSLLAIGSGSGGGGGFTGVAGSARGGGAGGGSGSHTRLLIPACQVPDTLYILTPQGGAGGGAGVAGSAGSVAYVAVRPDTSARNVLLVSGNPGSPGTGGGAGTGAAGGTGGTAASAATAAAMPLGSGAPFVSIAGQAGTNGGAQTGAAGSALTLPITGLILTGGTGGAGTTSGDFAGGGFGAAAGALVSEARPTVVYSGSNFDGSAGPVLRPPSGPLYFYGGIGGGAANAGPGGAGGTGAYGCGGGGGGGGTTGGPGGPGGPAFVQIVSW